jgi:hypothetical protein
MQHFSLTGQVRTAAFWGVAVFLAVAFLQLCAFLCTIKYQLQVLVHFDHAATLEWLVHMGYVVPLAGLVSTVLCESLVAHLSLWKSATLTYLISLLFSTCLMLLPAVTEGRGLLLWLVFVLFAVFRAMLMSVTAFFLTHVFGYESFSKLWALLFSIAGIVSASIMLWVYLTWTYLEGGYSELNMFLGLGTALVLIAFPLQLYTAQSRRKNKSIFGQDIAGDAQMLINDDIYHPDYNTFEQFKA